MYKAGVAAATRDVIAFGALVEYGVIDAAVAMLITDDVLRGWSNKFNPLKNSACRHGERWYICEVVRERETRSEVW